MVEVVDVDVVMVDIAERLLVLEFERLESEEAGNIRTTA